MQEVSFLTSPAGVVLSVLHSAPERLHLRNVAVSALGAHVANITERRNAADALRGEHTAGRLFADSEQVHRTAEVRRVGILESSTHHPSGEGGARALLDLGNGRILP